MLLVPLGLVLLAWRMKGDQPWYVDWPLTIMLWASCLFLMYWAYYAFSVLGDLLRGAPIR